MTNEQRNILNFIMENKKSNRRNNKYITKRKTGKGFGVWRKY